MKPEITRRKMLQIGGAALGGVLLTQTGCAEKKETPAPAALPWTWKHIEPESVQERAYQSAWARVGCMYGVVEGVIGTLADKYGAPYNTFPIAATVYGSGGLGGVGSMCGTVNAAGMIFGLFVQKEPDLFALCKEISIWYENTPMPTYKPVKPNQDIPIVTSVAGSNLCHISSTRWSNLSGHKTMTMAHFERCNRLVSDVAAKVVSMMNDFADNTLKFQENPNEFSEACIACHGSAGSIGNVEAYIACDTCHEDPHKK